MAACTYIYTYIDIYKQKIIKQKNIREEFENEERGHRQSVYQLFPMESLIRI